ncbi:MAG TPA: hypothetical protein VMV14_11070, partial [Acidimicrobiales bacterium]|nr:hypothetical protein [Acidimicrobiales bacterium]
MGEGARRATTRGRGRFSRVLTALAGASLIGGMGGGILAAIEATPAAAAPSNTCDWIGTAAGDWATAANWDCTGGVTVPGAGTAVVFPAAGQSLTLANTYGSAVTTTGSAFPTSDDIAAPSGGF